MRPCQKQLATARQALPHAACSPLLTGCACCRADYSQAPDIYYSPMDARMVVNGIRDEVRQVADGYLLGECTTEMQPCGATVSVCTI